MGCSFAGRLAPSSNPGRLRGLGGTPGAGALWSGGGHGPGSRDVPAPLPETNPTSPGPSPHGTAQIIVQACRLRKARKAGKASVNGWDTDAQVVEGAATAPPAAGGKRLPRHALIVMGLLVLLGLGTIGCSAWGMAASIQQTETQIPGFWDMVETTQNRASGIQTSLLALNASLPVMYTGLNIVIEQASNGECRLAPRPGVAGVFGAGGRKGWEGPLDVCVGAGVSGGIWAGPHAGRENVLRARCQCAAPPWAPPRAGRCG